MDEFLALAVGSTLGGIAALLAVLGIWLALRLSGRLSTHGLLPWFFPTQVAAAAISMAATGRSFDASGTVTSVAVTASWAGEWSIRIASIVALWGAVDAIIRWLRSTERVFSWRLVLILAFSFLWVTQVASPAWWGRHPSFQTYWVYALPVGVGLLCLDARAARQTLLWFRDAQVLFCFLSLVLAVVWPDLALQRDYEQGFIDGLPRLAGLAPHPISLAGVAATTLVVLLYFPYARPWLQRLAMLSSVLVVLLAQSKTVWLILALALPMVLAYQGRFPTWRSLSQQTPRTWLVGAYGLVLVGSLSGLALVVSGEVGHKLNSFLASSDGAQLMSLTGRDRIWSVALEEWRQDPLFGYGMPLFDEAHRAAVRMGAATHAHNQFVDSLARAGLVGLVGAVAYLLVLVAAAWRVATPSRGLSLGLLVILLAFAITEVPLSLTGIGLANFYHMVLLVVLGSALAGRGADEESPRAQ
ncbi:O-antigen ligase family protein [Ideonella sp.]|jgi:O-antigen ligase|uniref:O-antigen ligase family protein n=1 Tax=Ideonella sp. TaxID=1929293 RepID=UPI0037C0FA89